MVYQVTIGGMDKNKAKKGQRRARIGGSYEGKSEVITHRNLELGNSMETLGRV